jgi:protein gp37
VNKTSIEWTHRPETGGANGGFTWNPIRARLIGSSPKTRSGTFCTRISPGCTHCYASTINKRFGNGLEFTVPNLEKIEFFVDERMLEEPLRRKKPATIFVGDMFDLFHQAIPQEMVAEVLRVAWKLPRHTFQFLTKRAERLARRLAGSYTRR